MRDALARLEALERGAPGDKLLIVTERQTPDGPRYELPSGDLLPLPDVYVYMRLHGQGVLLIVDLPEPKRGRKSKIDQ